VDAAAGGEEEEEGSSPLQDPEMQVLNAHWESLVQAASKLPQRGFSEEEEA
jgi:hypothetical protein